MPPVAKSSLFATLPPLPAPADYARIRALSAAVGRKIVVLDDDPTGTQTVHGIPVLTSWSEDELAAELAGTAPCFYVLTNSRALPAPEAETLNRDIATNLRAASARTGVALEVFSRSDSILRGHFPLETDVLTAELGGDFDGVILAPAFLEGGRFTIKDTHYVAEGDQLIPAGETEFARDATFGYRASDLREWVAEKTAGRVPAARVLTIALALLRRAQPEIVRDVLLAAPAGSHIVVNAAAYADFEQFVLGLLLAEAAGRRYVFRTAASLVRVRAGIEPRPLLEATDFPREGVTGGLVVVGSYVDKTTRQLAAARALGGFAEFEVAIPPLLAPATRGTEIARLGTGISAALAAGQDVLVFTSRDKEHAAGRAGDLDLGRLVSDALVALVQGLASRPRFLIAKGGITSSDLATKGLGIRRAMVLGQLLPGVPVWEAGPETKFPGLPYVVFPGNVGDDGALAKAITTVRG